jgi:hypothetical protein
VIQTTMALTLIGSLIACVNPTAPTHAQTAQKAAGGGVIIGSD